MAQEFGPYIIESLIARGGMGDVYLALDTRLDRRVALKMLGEEWSRRSDSRDRFEREWRLAASLDHPHILPVFDAGEIDGRPFLAMRYVDGATVAELLRESGPFDPQRAVALVGQVASALDAAHTAGLVHRDVKPANVLVAQTSNGEHAYLTDFGVSRAIDHAVEQTRAGEFFGTADYIAPEQVEGRPIDQRVDVYSLTCMLYELLTGASPFRRDTPVATLFAHVQAPRPLATTIRPDLPPQLDGVLQRGFAVNARDRYGTAGELARAAEMALTGITLLADSHDIDSLRSATGHDQPTVAMKVPAVPPPALSPVAVSRTEAPAVAEPPAVAEARSIAGAATFSQAPTERRRRGLATPLVAVAMAVLLALAGLVAMQALSSDTPGVASAPGSGDNVSTATSTDDSGDGGVAAVAGCDTAAVAAPETGRWRLWRAEYGRRGNGDYLRLKLKREGDHEQTAAATVAVVPPDAVAANYGVNAPNAERVLVVAFDGPVSIGGGWGANPNFSALKEFRVERGAEGRVMAVAAIAADACYALSGGSWGQGNATDLTLEIVRP